MQKMLITALEILVGVLIVAAILLGFNTFKGKFDDALEQGSSGLDSAALSSYTEYEGETIKGEAVKQFIKSKYAQDDEIAIIVKTKKNTSGVYYVYDNNLDKISSDDESDLIKAAGTKTDNNYINPNAKFDCTIQRDSNDDTLILSITFEQQ